MSSQSLIREYKVNTSFLYSRRVLATIERTENDANGNPKYLIQVWSGLDGVIWYPKIKHYRERKDNKYSTSSHCGIEHTLDMFMERFESAVYRKEDF